jgi:outer membrane protein OmpA-like peptidoglycan-associated protein
MAKAASCKKCDPHELCEECPEWIFTLADLIMCMMGLFVILWCLKPGPDPTKKNMQEDEELMKTLAAIREAFGYIPDPEKTDDAVNTWMIIQKLHMLKPHHGPGQGGKTTLPREGPEGTDPEVMSVRPGDEVTMGGGKMTFEVGSAELTENTRRHLGSLAEVVRGHRNIFLVKGHTSLDDFPDGTSADRTMELSLRRAQAAADYLVSLGVAPDILRVQGCSTYEPFVERAYTPAVQATNRRVEVESTDTLVEQRQDRRVQTSEALVPTTAP